MRAIALKSFPYSCDGVSIRDLGKDEEFEVRDDLLEGLVQEKFIKLLTPGVRRPAQERKLRNTAPTELIALADEKTAAANAARAEADQARKEANDAGFLQGRGELKARADSLEAAAEIAETEAHAAVEALAAAKGSD